MVLSSSYVSHQASVFSDISCNIHPILKVKKRHKTTSNLLSHATNPILLSQIVEKWRTIENDYLIPQMVVESSFVSVHCLCMVMKKKLSFISFVMQ